MSDVRDLLDEAAGPPPGPVDVDRLRRRARRQQVLQAAAVLALVLAVVSLGPAVLRLDRGGPAPVIEQPDPGPPVPAVPADVPMQVPDGLSVEATLIRPSPWATGSGRERYLTAVVLRNDLADVAVEVGGQLSLHTSTGRRVATVEPRSVSIAPGAEGLLIERIVDVDDDPGDGASIGLELEVLAEVEDPQVPTPTVSDVSYEREAPIPCEVTGTVTNRSGTDIDQSRVAMLGYVDGQLSTANVADLPALLAGQSLPFSIHTPAAGCPAGTSLNSLRIIVELPIDVLVPNS